MFNRLAIGSVHSEAPNGRPLRDELRTDINSAPFLRGTHFGSPSSATFCLGSSQLFPLGKRAQQGIIASQSMAGITRPSILGRVSDHLSAERIGLDVAENHEQVGVILDHGALEPTLPHMTRGLMPLVITPGVGYCKGLKDSANRLSGLGPDQEVEVIGHETIAKEPEGVAVPGLGEGLEEGDAVVVVAEDVPAVVATVEGVIHRAVIDGAR